MDTSDYMPSDGMFPCVSSLLCDVLLGNCVVRRREVEDEDKPELVDRCRRNVWFRVTKRLENGLYILWYRIMGN